MRTIILAGFFLVHSWYPYECCSDQDCRPVPCDEVKEVDGAFFYRETKFERERVHSSRDGDCHVCITQWGVGMCLFVPLGS